MGLQLFMTSKELLITNFQTVLGISVLPNLPITKIWIPKMPPQLGEVSFHNGPIFPTRFLNAIEGRNPLFGFAKGSMTINDLLRLNPNQILNTRGMGTTTVDGIAKCLLWCEENIDKLVAFQFECSNKELDRQDLSHQNIITEIFNNFASELSSKERTVFNQRIISLEKITLDEVANDLGLTRERARQIEKTVLDKIREPKTKNQLELNSALIYLYEKLNIWQTFDSFLNEIDPILDGATYWWKFEDKIDSPSEILKTCLNILTLIFPKSVKFDGDEIHKTTGEEYFDFIKAVMSTSHDHTILAEDLYQIFASKGISESDINFLVKKYKLTRFGAFFILPTPNVVDQCIAGLHLIGEPIEVGQLLAELGINLSKHSVGDRLRNDPRIMRAGRTKIALREWVDWSEYEGIADTIEKVVKKNKGIHINELLKHFNQFPDISERSVMAYLAVPQYLIHENIVYFREKRDFPKAKPKFDENTFSLRSDKSKIVHRIQIDYDVLRGSGKVIKVGLAGALNVQPGTKKEFSSKFGDIKFYWDPRLAQPARGSIKHILEESNLTSVTEVFFIFDTKLGTFTLSQSKPF